MSSKNQGQTPDGKGIGRRDLLKKSAIAGGVVWTAPVLLSTQAAAAGTPGANVCPPGPGKTRTTSLTFQWNPGTCSGGEGLGCRNPSDDALRACSGDSSGWASATVTATDNMGSLTVTGSPVASTGTFTVATNQANDITITLTKVGGTATQTFSLHISCSDPICIGDRYGALTLVDGY